MRLVLQGARNEIFALMPAPVQCSYMGFPATMGASFLPYLITDRAVAPDSCRHCYSENLALMPNCYFVNDYKHAHMVSFTLSKVPRIGKSQRSAVLHLACPRFTAGWDHLTSGRIDVSMNEVVAASGGRDVHREGTLAMCYGNVTCAHSSGRGT